jgi:hypothetical protein
MPEQEQQQAQAANIAGAIADSPAAEPGFGGRGRARRRLRFLRKARELAYRDLGGLVFNLHRFGQRNDPLVVAKLGMLDRIDAELRALESALADRQPVTVLREAGITACPRCAAIHGSEDRFCPNCGLPAGRHANLPIAGALADTANGTSASGIQASASTPQAPGHAAAPSSSPATEPSSSAAGSSPSAAERSPSAADPSSPAAESSSPATEPSSPATEPSSPAAEPSPAASAPPTSAKSPGRSPRPRRSASRSGAGSSPQQPAPASPQEPAPAPATTSEPEQAQAPAQALSRPAAPDEPTEILRPK